MIRIRDVSKAYASLGKRHQVFRGLNLEFPRGRNTGLVGPNGSGKSTLLRLITGAELPDEGIVTRDARLSWPIGFGGELNHALTGVANARFCARVYGADPDYAVAFVAEFAGLQEYMRWPVKSYSTGMRAKFSFALSMAIDFDCLLVDEILGVGDAEFRAKCAAAIDARRARTDMILVSHNLKDIIQYCDRVVILGGKQPIVSDDVKTTVKQYAIALGNVQEAMEA